MGLIDALPVQRVRPVLYLPFWLGTLRDHSGFNHHSLVSTALCWWNNFGPSDTIYDGILTVANTTRLEAIADWTLFWCGDLKSSTDTINSRIFSKRDGGGTHFEVFATSTQVRVYNGTVAVAAVAVLDASSSATITHINGGTPNMYLNGTLFGAMSGDITTTTNDADIYLKGLYTGATTTLDHSGICALLLYDAVLTPTEIIALHTWSQSLFTPRKQWPGAGLDYVGAEFDGEPRFLDNIQTARVSLANETSGQLSNTTYKIISGVWRVKEDTATRRRWIECITAGRLARRNLHAYGTHHLKVEHVGATRNTLISSNTEALGGGSKNGYDVTLTSGNDLRLIRYLAGVSANLFLDDAGEYPDGEYDIRMTRALDGEITVYINGILVDPLSGSNPIIDTNVTTSLYTLYDYDAGDRLYLDRQFAGVLPP